MKKLLCVLLVILVGIYCCSCKKEDKSDIQSVDWDAFEEEQEEEETEEQEDYFKEGYYEENPEDTHSKLYMEQYSVEDVIKYFNEVVLKAEYSDGDGDSALVQRWDVPIRYVLEGEYTEEDVKILNELFNELNKIEDFSGISEATQNEVPNLHICFYGRQELDENFLEFVQGESVDGVNRYWYYTDTNDIYEGKIGYLKDLEGDIRKSVLLEEIVNGLGMGDTELREDSIVYQYGSEVTALSDMDWLILKLMYNKRIRCGMDAAQCEEIIRELYY